MGNSKFCFPSTLTVAGYLVLMNHLNKFEINVCVPVSEILSFHCPVTLLSTGFFCGPRACFTQQRTDSVISESILFTKSKSFQGSCGKVYKKEGSKQP